MKLKPNSIIKCACFGSAEETCTSAKTDVPSEGLTFITKTKEVQYTILVKVNL